MGCQQEIIKTIVEKDADYVIAVKQNQPTLHKQIKQLFKQAIETHGDNLNMSSFNSREINRGREEIRNYLMITDVMEQIDPLQKWKNLTSIGMVESVRVVNEKTALSPMW